MNILKKSLILLLCFVFLVGCSSSKKTSEVKKESHTESIKLDIPKYKKIDENHEIKVKGKRIKLAGKRTQVNDILADVPLDEKSQFFNEVKQTKLSTKKGYTLIYTAPSLDTPVCSKQSKELEAAARKFKDVNFIVITNDTPFAIERFCTANNISNLTVLSDARTHEFGIQNGFMMTEYALQTRAVLIVDNALKVKYVDYNEEVTDETDLLNAFAYLQEQVK